MDILRTRSRRKLSAGGLCIPEKLKALCDRSVVGIKFRSTSVGINGVGDLIVTAFIKAPKIKPNLRNIRVDADGTRVCIKRISELIDLEVQNTD